MQKQLLTRITQTVAISGVLLVLLAGVLFKLPGVLSSLVAAVVAFLNWRAMRWIAEGLGERRIRSTGRFATLALLKTGALFGVCWLAITTLQLHATAFILGVSALPIGIFLGPLTLPETDNTLRPAASGASTEQAHD